MGQKDIYVTRTSMPSYEEYIEAIKPLWDSHWITNMGTYHKQLETKLQEYLDVPNVSLMVNGHMALELTLQSFEFPENSEIITTPFTFISTTHAIVRNNLKPVFCDIKVEDGTIDETKIEALITEKTVAILPVHVYGNVCSVEKIQEIADRHHLKVIYDAAHAFGVRYMQKGIGQYGDASVFSFHATKVFNTIEGGAVSFSNSNLYDRLYNLKNFGIRGEELVVSVGANAKMNEFSAIMGLCNLKHLEDNIRKRKFRFDIYHEKLQGVKGIRLFENQRDTVSNYAYCPIMITEEYPLTRDKLYLVLKKNHIHARKYFYPLTSEQECYQGQYNNNELKNAKQMANQILILPLYDELDLDIINSICEIIASAK